VSLEENKALVRRFIDELCPDSGSVLTGDCKGSILQKVLFDSDG